ncbi:MAG: hypothetical protein WC848_00855 [Parcubacteria group bacterium]|jgi:hypothetical protein
MPKIVLVSKKPLIIFLAMIVLLVGGYFGYKKYQKNKLLKGNVESVYEVLVQMADEKVNDPVEDARSSLKRGDVIAYVPDGHQWSDTEKISYLIVKIKLKPEEAQKLMEAETKNAPVDEARKKELPEGAGPEKETVRARKYQINLDKLDVEDLTINDLAKGQPTGDKVFGENVIRKK